jgi:hypothetical protein
MEENDSGTGSLVVGNSGTGVLVIRNSVQSTEEKRNMEERLKLERERADFEEEKASFLLTVAKLQSDLRSKSEVGLKHDTDIEDYERMVKFRRMRDNSPNELMRKRVLVVSMAASGSAQMGWLISYTADTNLNPKSDFAFLGGVKSLKSVNLDRTRFLTVITLLSYKRMTDVMTQLQVLRSQDKIGHEVWIEARDGKHMFKVFRYGDSDEESLAVRGHALKRNLASVGSHGEAYFPFHIHFLI